MGFYSYYIIYYSIIFPILYRSPDLSSPPSLPPPPLPLPPLPMWPPTFLPSHLTFNSTLTLNPLLTHHSLRSSPRSHSLVLLRTSALQTSRPSSRIYYTNEEGRLRIISSLLINSHVTLDPHVRFKSLVRIDPYAFIINPITMWDWLLIFSDSSRA